ncbi:MAG TPA: hypothetical protein VLQ93_12095, partial [Myxococcaceae bacterium]|nr:hypothetical protein [Myxococcaceae bacterium]
MRGERWLIYALGGGLGHLTRALGLGRVARARGHRVRVVTNSPFASCLPLEAELGEGAVHPLDAGLDKHAVREAITRLLEQERPEVLVVDTFPRGLGGELAPLLPGLRARKVLVHRDLKPNYEERFDLERFVDTDALLLLPGEPAPLGHHPSAVRTPPWLVRDAEELADFTEARRRLQVPADTSLPVVAVLACGHSKEVEESAMLAEELRRRLGSLAVIRLLSPCPLPPGSPEALRLWPALEVLRGVDVLVGAGGYNTVQEARATGTPLVALVRPRLYDRQALRLRAGERVSTPWEVISRVQALLPSPRPGPPSYINGT